MNFQHILGYNQSRIVGQELEDEKSFLGEVMTMWAGQIRTGLAGFRNPGREHSPIRNYLHQVGLRGDVIRRLRQIGRTRLCEDSLPFYPF
eukprot:8134255-Pyramimonas_sp.AAC.1